MKRLAEESLVGRLRVLLVTLLDQISCVGGTFDVFAIVGADAMTVSATYMPSRLDVLLLLLLPRDMLAGC
jgi:hypothetical protein